MQIILDSGNTRLKIAVFHKAEIIDQVNCDHDSGFDEVQRVIAEYPDITSGIVSDVGHMHKDITPFLEKKINFLQLSHELAVPFINQYATPTTLGVDRIALVCGGLRFRESVIKKNNPLLIIDAGTCVTYDFINSKNEYKGGAIAPGLRLRYESMHNLTASLPLLEVTEPEHHIGDTTAMSMHSGVVNGLRYEIDGAVSAYKSEFKNLTVLITGGDHKVLSMRLKNSIFAVQNLMLNGLHEILQFNTNQ